MDCRDYLRRIPLSTAIASHEFVRSYIFVDNSNIFIEGQKAAAKAENSEVAGKLYRVDFGRLFAFLRPRGNECFFSLGGEDFPKLYGSEPPPLDSLWKILGKMGVSLKIFRKNPRGLEKRVDAALIWDYSRLILELQKTPDGELVIVAGDADYYDLIERGKERRWKVRIVCWRHATAQIVQRLPQFEDLTPHLKQVGFFERYKFDHEFGDWGGKIDWSKVVPYGDKSHRKMT